MFTFTWPFAFLLLPVFWLAQRYWPMAKQKNEAMLKIPFLFRIEELNQRSKLTTFFPQRLKQWVAFCVWLLMVIACANPQWLGKPIPIVSASRNLMLAVDLSPSMQIPDLQRGGNTLNRLDTIKEVAAPFIEKRNGDKLGLILFGSKAYLQTPLTLDRNTVRTMLDDATIGLAGGRTAIGDAIALGVKKLQSENINSRILILFTDGGNNSGNIQPLEAAKLAKDNHIKIYAVGIGAKELMISGFFGSQAVNPSADLDEKTLKQIADMTQGQYFRAQDEKALTNILEAINQLEPIKTASEPLRPITALFYLPLTLALLLILLLIFPNFNSMKLNMMKL